MSQNLPAVDDPITEGFWTASKEHVLTAQKCLECGDMRYPALELCPKCWSTNQTWEPIAPGAELYSFVVYRRALDPSTKDEIPYVVGRVKTDDGPLFTVRLEVAPEDAKVGMRLSPTWYQVNDEVTLLRFAAE